MKTQNTVLIAVSDDLIAGLSEALKTSGLARNFRSSYVDSTVLTYGHPERSKVLPSFGVPIDSKECFLCLQRLPGRQDEGMTMGLLARAVEPLCGGRIMWALEEVEV